MSNNNLFEIDCNAKAVKPEFGADTRGRPKIRVEMEIVDGDRKGVRVPYEGKLDEGNIKYTKRDMVTLGWAGKDVRTFVDDVTKAAKVVPIRTRIATYDKGDGSPIRQWTSVGSIGFAAAPLAQLETHKVADVNKWFAEAEALQPPSQPQANGTSSRSDDMPF